MVFKIIVVGDYSTISEGLTIDDTHFAIVRVKGFHV